MNSLRKIGNWIWLNKERMVLAIMVGFLIFRVYQVVQPPEPGDNNAPMPFPKPTLSEEVVRPGLPPAVPPSPRVDDWSRLRRLNPFQWREPRRAGGAADTATQDVDLTLLRITPSGADTYRAQIRSSSRTGWYEEGDAFESYELLAIDPAAGTVTVFAEELQRALELPLSER